MTRTEHLSWCKQRALEYVHAGDTHTAFASMLSDLGKHDETKAAQQLCQEMGGMLLLGGHLNTLDQMQRFIEGFN